MDCIERITKRRGDDGVFRFVAELSDGASKATVEVSAAALQSYTAFQREVLATAGILFRCHAYEAHRVGLVYWRDDVECLLDAAEVAPA